ncbi:dNTP triphosphohydrolase [Cytobacillus oceanisediminis]|uniref:dGTP triphosphohydrolase n=1 Tax=Cytobacillus oceanisediminis TaxID=665099 RepID=UPI001D151219|nr:dNTP triphosphohydrolase [Cytobacillus oceanisediminis]MCC3647426.1 dNTP triphosphohydrolase [Cytobacillus oceanisediminis]
MEQFKMEWDDLLSGVRLRKREIATRDNEYDQRNDFDDDYSRLIFSSSVRRLQDKAQVFPLDSSDFIRTRLTHSHEVSTIGRSLGISIEKKLNSEGKLHEKHIGKISSLLAVAGLVHDLGNPPYGHFGEAAIQQFFKDWFKTEEGKKVKEEIGPEKAADFEYFEGNAQTFRLLTRLHNLKHEYGYDLSVASLASIIKYPRSSTEGNKNSEKRKAAKLGISYKKFGYLQSEKEKFEQLIEFTGIGKYRHPVTFLLEAADDIAYSAADIEDGCKKSVLDYTSIEVVLKKHLANGSEDEKYLYNYFVNKYQENVKMGRADKLDNTVQRFRIKAQGYMIKSVVKKFLEVHDDILTGSFDKDILKASDARNVRLAFEDLAYQIFKDKEILVREITGGAVIDGLLERFVGAVLSEDRLKPNTKDGKLYLLISGNYRDIMDSTIILRTNGNGEGTHPEEAEKQGPTTYEKLLLVTDFVCGMTDTYALDLYRRLTGIKL